jgi:hypothetical protein
MKKPIEHESIQFSENIESIVLGISRKLKAPEEMVVINIILAEWRKGFKVTQRAIASEATWIGVHPKWETKSIEAGFLDTSTRRVRDVIRTLRIDRGLPVLSDSDGYFFPFTEKDAPTVLKRFEAEVIKRNASSVRTYQELQKIFKTRSEVMERLTQIAQLSFL